MNGESEGLGEELSHIFVVEHNDSHRRDLYRFPAMIIVQNFDQAALFRSINDDAPFEAVTKGKGFISFDDDDRAGVPVTDNNGAHLTTKEGKARNQTVQFNMAASGNRLVHQTENNLAIHLGVLMKSQTSEERVGIRNMPVGGFM
jgi:hypothetical protein